MTKADLVALIAGKAKLSKAASERTLNAFLAAIQETLTKGEKVTLTGFGSFSVEMRKERKGRNPRTGATIKIPATKAVRFRPGKNLKAIGKKKH